MTDDRSIRPRRSGLRRSLLLGCASIGLTSALMRPGEAAAQAFIGTPQTVAGSVAYSRDTTPQPNQETISIRTPSAVINWSLPPSESDPHVFLPAGNTATFQGGAPFTVLNRIIPNGGMVIRLDGTILSRLATDTGAVPGGLVAFYSPNGLIIGANAVIDVGGLILTTLDPAFDSGGNIFGSGGVIDLQAAPNFPNSFVTTEAGAQITASPEGSFVLFAAPQITHGGSVRVNGSAAYVGAAGAEVAFNSGLFDIVVTDGTTRATPIVHNGTTGGPASTGATDPHRIYMAGVSQAAAINLLIRGTIGFDAPVSATVENGAIILSAGFDVQGDLPDRPANSTPPIANLTIDGGNFTSDVRGFATDNALASGSPTFQQDLALSGGALAVVTTDAGLLRVGGDLSLSTRVPIINPAQLDRTGGTARVLSAETGRIEVGGNTILDAGATSLYNEDNGDVGNATGGSAEVLAFGGQVDLAGNLTILANADTAPIEATPSSGGSATGGVATLGAEDRGTIEVAGALVLQARGDASSSSGAAAGDLTAQGGTAQIHARALGGVAVEGTTTIDVRGRGGSVESGISNAGGDGIGGTFGLDAGPGQVVLTGALTVNASGEGGLGPVGGAGLGGKITVTGSRGSITLGTGNRLIADGRGSAATFLPGGAGGEGVGGEVIVRVAEADSAEAGAITSGSLSVSAVGRGGNGGGANSSSEPTPAGAGADGEGGTARVESTPGAGQMSLGPVLVDVRGIGGNGGSASGSLGAGAAGSGIGGLVTTGIQEVTPVGAAAGRATYAAIEIDASGLGGSGSIGGAGIGGNGSVNATLGSTVSLTGPVRIIANGIGGGGVTTPGNGQGGVASVTSGGTMSLFGLTLSANASAPAGASGLGGVVALTTNNNNLTFTDAVLEALSTGSPNIPVSGSILISGTNATLSGGTLRATADNDIVVGGLATTTSIDLLARDFLTVNGPVASPIIRATSRDIDIQGPGSLGQANAAVTLTVQPSAAQAVLGGATADAGYMLDAAEAGRILAGTLTVVAPAQGLSTPDLAVRDLTIDGARITNFVILAPGIVQVDGNLLMSNAGAANSIRLVGSPLTQRVQIVTPSGSIRVRDAGGAPAGLLRIDAANIWVTDQAILTQLIANPNFTGRNAALLVNSGPFAPRGYLEAFDVSLRAGASLYVQNSGTGTDLAGITIGGGALSINAGGSTAPADVYAFGRRVRPDGSFTTGNAFFAEVNFTGSYTTGSEFNQCNITTRVCPTTPTPPPTPPTPPPTPPTPPPTPTVPPPTPPTPPPTPPVPPPTPPVPPPTPPVPPPTPPVPPPTPPVPPPTPPVPPPTPPSPPPTPPVPPPTPAPPPNEEVPPGSSPPPRGDVAPPVDGPSDPPPADGTGNLIDTSGGAEPLIEEPVTSGGDSSAWTEDADEDRDEDEDEDEEQRAPVTGGPLTAPPIPGGAAG